MRPALNPQKERERAEICRHVADFIAAGGTIQKIEAQIFDLRAYKQRGFIQLDPRLC
jgi:hypothetical protein